MDTPDLRIVIPPADCPEADRILYAIPGAPAADCPAPVPFPCGCGPCSVRADCPAWHEGAA
jgi:hypothetical protein